MKCAKAFVAWENCRTFDEKIKPKQMKLLFNLEYRTNFGEELVLNVIGENQQVEQHVMSTQDGYRWTVEMNGKQAVAGKFMDYYYSLMRGDKEIRHVRPLD